TIRLRPWLRRQKKPKFQGSADRYLPSGKGASAMGQKSYDRLDIFNEPVSSRASPETAPVEGVGARYRPPTGTPAPGLLPRPIGPPPVQWQYARHPAARE